MREVVRLGVSGGEKASIGSGERRSVEDPLEIERDREDRERDR